MGRPGRAKEAHMSESIPQGFTRLVAVEFKPGGKRYIYEAPPFGESLEPGDTVMTDQNVIAKVVGVELIDTDIYRETVEFILSAAGASYPLKRIKGVMRDIADGRDWCAWPGWDDAAEAEKARRIVDDAFAPDAGGADD